VSITDCTSHNIRNNLQWSKDEFSDTKGEIRIRKSQKDRQHNGQKKKVTRTNNDLQSIHIKQKIE
jgi:hypothetical protein